MAKRKNSTALFEVMAAHRARMASTGGSASSNSSNSSSAPAPSRSSAAPRTTAAPSPGQPYQAVEKPSIFAIGKKWFATMMEKRAQSAASAPAPVQTEALDPNDPTAGVTAQGLMSRRSSAAQAAASDPAPAASADAESASSGPVTYTTVMPTYGRSNDVDLTRPGPKNHVEFDRDRHQVTLKVRLNTAVISLTALLVVVGTAYIIGKRAGKPAAAAGNTAQPSPAPQPTPQAKVTPGGPLDVGNGAKPRNTRPPRADDANLAGNRIPGNSRDSTAGIQPAPTGGTGSGQLTPNAAFEDAAVANGIARRTIGLNYAVIQRYGPDMQDVAVEVSDYLNAHGVPNTIESGSKRIQTPSDWCAIVGTRGFGRGFGQTAEFQEYEKAIHRAAQAYPKKNKFKDQSPEMRRWTE